MRINRSRPVTNPRITQALTEREEIREAADLLARDLAAALAELTVTRAALALARARNDSLVDQLATAKDTARTFHAEWDLARGEVEALRLTLPADGDLQLRHALHRSEALRANQDRRLAELAALPCPRPCCARVVTP